MNKITNSTRKVLCKYEKKYNSGYFKFFLYQCHLYKNRLNIDIVYLAVDSLPHENIFFLNYW